MIIFVDSGIKINEDDEKEILENMESDSAVMAKEEMDKRICKMKRGKTGDEDKLPVEFV